MQPPAFIELVARQAGVVTIMQAVATGVPRRTVQRWARAWTRLHPGVYLVAGHLPGHETRVRAAVLWAGAGAALSGQAAAWWLGLPADPPVTIDVIVPRDRKPRRQPGVRVHRRDLARPDRVVQLGVQTVSDALAALETAIAMHDGSTFLDRVLQRHVRFPALYRCYCRHLGRPGSAPMALLITAAADRADSAAERLLIALLRAAKIEGWAVGVPFGPFTIDLAFALLKVAIEVDGWAWHVDAARFRNDRRKGNALANGGWTLLRFTWHDLTQHPERCRDEVLVAVRAAAA